MKNKSPNYLILTIIIIFLAMFVYLYIKDPGIIKGMIATGGIYWVIGIFVVVIFLIWLIHKYTPIGKIHSDFEKYSKQIRHSAKTMNKKEFKTKMKNARNRFIRKNKALVTAAIIAIPIFIILIIYFFKSSPYDDYRNFLKIWAYLIGAFLVYVTYKFMKFISKKTK